MMYMYKLSETTERQEEDVDMVISLVEVVGLHNVKQVHRFCIVR